MAVRVLRAGLSPIKGTRHLGLPSVAVDAQGAVGDRTYCLVDVAAARVLRTVQHPALLTVTARVEANGDLSLTLPDGRTACAPPVPSGETLTCDYWGRPTPVELVAGPHAELFSDLLGKPVAVARAPRRGVIYGAGISIVTRASLDDLAERAGVGIDPARFRSTLVLDTGDEPYAEEDWAGRDLAIGDVTLRIGWPVPRCAVVDIEPATGERGSRLLRTLAGYRPLNRIGEPCFGVYAEVRTPGVVVSASQA